MPSDLRSSELLSCRQDVCPWSFVKASALHYRLGVVRNFEQHVYLGAHLASNRAGFLLDRLLDTDIPNDLAIRLVQVPGVTSNSRTFGSQIFTDQRSEPELHARMFHDSIWTHAASRVQQHPEIWAYISIVRVPPSARYWSGTVDHWRLYQNVYWNAFRSLHSRKPANPVRFDVFSSKRTWTGSTDRTWSDLLSKWGMMLNDPNTEFWQNTLGEASLNV